MSKKKKYKVKQIAMIMYFMNKRLVELALYNLLGKKDIDVDSEVELSRTKVVATKSLDDEDLVIPMFIKVNEYLESLDKGQRELLEKDVLAVYDVFSDERFIKAYFYGTHDDLMDVIERLYFEFKMNAKMLRTLDKVGVVKLTSKEHERFGKIKLLYSWDDPIYIDAGFTEEELESAFCFTHGIKKQN